MKFFDTLKPSASPSNTFTLANKEFPKVTWWREPGLRRLYLLLLVPLMTSMVNGYDGSMMNALQTSGQWQDYFHHPRGSLLAFYNLAFGLGQLLAVVPFPFPATIADKLGRRWGIVIGSIIAIIGVAIQSASIDGEKRKACPLFSPCSQRMLTVVIAMAQSACLSQEDLFLALES